MTTRILLTNDDGIHSDGLATLERALREIGDVIFTTPAVRALRHHFSDAHITYIVEPQAADVVRSNPHIDELIVALFLSGIASETLPVHIWNSLQMNVDPTVVAVSSVFIGATVLVLLVDWALRRVRARTVPARR